MSHPSYAHTMHLVSGTIRRCAEAQYCPAYCGDQKFSNAALLQFLGTPLASSDDAWVARVSGNSACNKGCVYL